MAGEWRRVLLVGGDAADWRVIHPLMDAGKSKCQALWCAVPRVDDWKVSTDGAHVIDCRALPPALVCVEIAVVRTGTVRVIYA